MKYALKYVLKYGFKGVCLYHALRSLRREITCKRWELALGNELTT